MKPHTLKMRTIGGKWYVDEGYKVTAFDTSTEAWFYIFLLREIRPKATYIPRTLYPVKHLNPIPTRGYKKVVHTFG